MNRRLRIYEGHIVLPLTVGRDRKIQTVLRTNKIARFVTILPEKKIEDDINLFFH